MIKTITSKDNSRIKYAASLSNSKYRKENHQFLAEGIKSLELAIRANLVGEVFTTEPLSIDNSISQYIVDMDLIRKISNSINPEGIVFICNEPTYQLSKDAKKIIYLDHIQDPGNMGTIIRTALAFNYDAVIVSDGSVSFYNEKVISSTKGSIFLIPVLSGNLKDYVGQYDIIVSSLDEDSVNFKKCKLDKPFVLVIGNEAHGVSEDTLKLATNKVKIPVDNIDSLNASIAAGILMENFR